MTEYLSSKTLSSLMEILGSISGTSIDIKQREERQKESINLLNNHEKPANIKQKNSKIDKFKQLGLYSEIDTYKGIKVKRCRELFSWQKEIVDILANKNDVYVLASPGAGKTLPVFCYFMQYCLKLNSIDNSQGSMSEEEVSILVARILNALNLSDQLENVKINNNKSGILYNFISKISRLIVKEKSSNFKNSKILIAVPIRKLLDEYYENFCEIYGDIITGSLKFLSLHYNNNNLSSDYRDSLGIYITIILNNLIEKKYIDDYLKYKKENIDHLCDILKISRDTSITVDQYDSLPDYVKQRFINETKKLDAKLNYDIDQSIKHNRDRRDSIFKKCINLKSGTHTTDDFKECKVGISIYSSLGHGRLIKAMGNDLGLFFIDESHNLHIDQLGLAL